MENQKPRKKKSKSPWINLELQTKYNYINKIVKSIETLCNGCPVDAVIFLLFHTDLDDKVIPQVKNQINSIPIALIAFNILVLKFNIDDPQKMINDFSFFYNSLEFQKIKLKALNYISSTINYEDLQRYIPSLTESQYKYAKYQFNPDKKQNMQRQNNVLTNIKKEQILELVFQHSHPSRKFKWITDRLHLNDLDSNQQQNSSSNMKSIQFNQISPDQQKSSRQNQQTNIQNLDKQLIINPQIRFQSNSSDIIVEDCSPNNFLQSLKNFELSQNQNQTPIQNNYNISKDTNLLFKPSETLQTNTSPQQLQNRKVKIDQYNTLSSSTSTPVKNNESKILIDNDLESEQESQNSDNESQDQEFKYSENDCIIDGSDSDSTENSNYQMSQDKDLLNESDSEKSNEISEISYNEFQKQLVVKRKRRRINNEIIEELQEKDKLIELQSDQKVGKIQKNNENDIIIEYNNNQKIDKQFENQEKDNLIEKQYQTVFIDKSFVLENDTQQQNQQ